jgi:hypothetical protein
MPNPKIPALQRPVAFLSAALLSTLLASGAALAVSGTNASIIAMSQKAKNDAVSITYAYLPKDGSLDVYAVSPSGKHEGKALGNVALKAGDHRNFAVTLNPVPEKGEKLIAVIEQSGQPLTQSGDRAERTFSVL